MQTVMNCSHPKPCQHALDQAWQTRNAHRPFPGMDGTELWDGPFTYSFSVWRVTDSGNSECYKLGCDKLRTLYVFPSCCSSIDSTATTPNQHGPRYLLTIMWFEERLICRRHPEHSGQENCRFAKALDWLPHEVLKIGLISKWNFEKWVDHQIKIWKLGWLHMKL